MLVGAAVLLRALSNGPLGRLSSGGSLLLSTVAFTAATVIFSLGNRLARRAVSRADLLTTAALLILSEALALRTSDLGSASDSGTTIAVECRLPPAGDDITSTEQLVWSLSSVG